MSLWVILPVKPLNRAKSRLAPVLSPDQRAEFAEQIMRQMLQVLTKVKEISGVLVISRDPKVLSIAREYGAKTVQESGSPELNGALTRATQVVKAWLSDGILILPADLPFVTEEDIKNLIQMGKEMPSIVVATDSAKDGTNALLVRPPGLIDYHYGEGSYEKHIEAARQAGAFVEIYKSETIELDIDVPSDLELYMQKLQLEGEKYTMLPMFGESLG